MFREKNGDKRVSNPQHGRQEGSLESALTRFM